MNYLKYDSEKLLKELKSCLGDADNTDRYLNWLASSDPKLSTLVMSCYRVQLEVVRYLENALEVPEQDRYKEIK